jgi:hypothetical protein
VEPGHDTGEDSIGDQKDVAAFVTTESSRTTVGITKNGKDIVRMD